MLTHATCLCRIPFRSSVFQGAFSASPLVPAPLEFRNLAVRPATRFSWPPHWSLRHRGGFGSPRASAGELCGTDLHRSRRKGVRQHPCPRLGPITVVWKWSLTVCLSFTEAVCRTGWSRLYRPSPSHHRAHLPTGEHGRARLVMLACETGGRWSEEPHSFRRQLAQARARSKPREMRAAARRAWFRRWCIAQAFALSLLECRGGLGSGGSLPSTTDATWEDHRGLVVN